MIPEKNGKQQLHARSLYMYYFLPTYVCSDKINKKVEVGAL